MRVAALLAALALLALLVVPADAVCAYGSRPCGAGCTPPLGWCEGGACFDRKGKRVGCEPNLELCAGVACELSEFCAGRNCKPNTCKDRRAFACPADGSQLRSVECESSIYTDCYRSDHFNCSLGPSASAVSCSAAAAESSAPPARPRAQVRRCCLHMAAGSARWSGSTHPPARACRLCCTRAPAQVLALAGVLIAAVLIACG